LHACSILAGKACVSFMAQHSPTRVRYDCTSADAAMPLLSEAAASQATCRLYAQSSTPQTAWNRSALLGSNVVVLPCLLMFTRNFRRISRCCRSASASHISRALLTAFVRLTLPQAQMSSRPVAHAASRLRTPHPSCSVAFGSPPQCAIPSQAQKHQTQLQSDTWPNTDKPVQLSDLKSTCEEIYQDAAQKPSLEACTRSARDEAGCRACPRYR